MFGRIFLILYVIIQICMSFLTEFVIKKNKLLKGAGEKTRILRIIIYSLLAIIPVLGAFLPPCDIKYSCMKFGNLWLGFFMYYSGIVIFLALILLIVSKIRKDDEGYLMGHALNFAFVIALGLNIYGLIHAQNPVLVNYEIEIEKEVPTHKELRVALLGDLHLSVNSDIELTEKMVDLVNESNPDVVLIAGDIFTSNYEGLKDPDDYAKVLSEMEAKYGVYVVVGNHDVEENLFSGFSVSPVSKAFRTHDMESFFDAAGFNVLYDESIEIADEEIVVVGRLDGEKAGDGTSNRKSASDILSNVDKTKPVIVLQHEPIEFEDLSKNGADLVLCGHTHNGQVFPGNLVVPFFNENGYGVKELYGTQTVVTAGVGYYGPPLRIGTDSEVTIIDIVLD